MKTGVSRRGFLTATATAAAGAGASVSAGVGAGRYVSSSPVESTGTVDVYGDLGVRPFINAAGTYTALSASLMPDEVVAAMEAASRSYVSLIELQQAAGKRIAALTGAESALVTAGCAAALTLATAACVCGEDEEAIRRVPDVEGLRSEVIFPKGQRFGYDHAIRNVGVTIVEVENKGELLAAINEKTAMLFYLNFAANRSPISREELVAAGKQKGIPTLIDAAADLPPASNLRAFNETGFDLVAFSGGKGLRGPQCSGILMGRRDLIAAAFANGSPNSNSVGRLAKVGKEEIAGLTKAVELYLKRDHEADWREWESRVAHILDAVRDIDGVEVERFVPEIANEVPHAGVSWDPERLPLLRDDVAKALRDGEPRIELRPGPGDAPRVEVGVWMMARGDHEIVARRLREVLSTSTSA